MKNIRFAVLLFAMGACGPETTSFRTTDRGDGAQESGPSAAAYDVRLAGEPVAQVHVWSNGGYLSRTDEPTTHAGFEVRNISARPIIFDSDMLELIVFDSASRVLPPTRFTSLVPLGPSQVQIRPGATVMLAAYFLLPVRPRAVARMQLRWSLRMNDDRYLQVTSFVRDDDAPGIDPRPLVEARSTRS